MICVVIERKGFHTVPSYFEDVKKVFNELNEINAFIEFHGRKLKCECIEHDEKILDDCFLIVRHKHKCLFIDSEINKSRTLLLFLTDSVAFFQWPLFRCTQTVYL